MQSCLGIKEAYSCSSAFVGSYRAVSGIVHQIKRSAPPFAQQILEVRKEVLGGQQFRAR
jgi:hypothetical protein